VNAVARKKGPEMSLLDHRFFAVTIVGVASAALFGCSGARVHTDATSNALSIEDARKALVKLVERTDNRALNMSLQTLKTANADKDEGGNLTLGPWIVNLKERRFVVSLVAGPIFEEYGGKFARTGDGNWTATIDHETRS
jgi:hypothetical protein